MVRSLMMILGLSLAVAALGCDSEGGKAGAGGAGGAVTDACINDTDTAAICDDGFEALLTACPTQALGQGAGTSTCLQLDPPGLSKDCADCYGDQTQCGFDNCLTECTEDSEGDPCRNCVATNCAADFAACSGVVDCGAGGAGGGGGDGGGGGGSG